MLFFFPVSGGKMDQLGHHPLQIHIESHSNANVCNVFLKAYLWCSKPFTKRAYGSHMFCFLVIIGNKFQYMSK